MFLWRPFSKLMSSAYYLSNMLDFRSIDICGISEQWLYASDLHFINSLHSYFNGIGISDSDLNINTFRKVGKGGVAIIWRKSLNPIIPSLCIVNDRIIAVQVRVSPEAYIYVLQVYLPSSNHNISMFRDCIQHLYDLVTCIPN